MADLVAKLAMDKLYGDKKSYEPDPKPTKAPKKGKRK